MTTPTPGWIDWTCPNCGKQARTTLTRVRCTCGTISTGAWTVTYEGHELTLNTPDYLELKQLSHDDPTKARDMARRLLDDSE